MNNRLKNSQKQEQKLQLKPLFLIVACTSLIGILAAVLILIFNVGTPGDARAASGCTSCTYTINGNSSQSYNLGNGQTLCITSSGNFTGSVSIAGGAKVCNSGTFNPSSLAFSWGAELENSNEAVIPGNFSNVGTLINSGNVSFSGNLTNNGSLANTGVITVNGNFTNTSSGGSNMSTTNQFIVSGNFINQNALVNDGLISVEGYFENANTGSATFTNNDSLYVGGYFNNYQDFTNNGGVLITGNFYNKNSGSTRLYNNGNMTVGADLQSEQLIDNNGRFTVMGNMTMSNSGSTATINDSIFVIMGDLTSNNVVTNNSYMQINGTYTNQKSSGKFVVGPESLLDVDSFVNNNNIQNNSTPYGQIVVYSFMDNSGTIASYVDICKANNGPTFDANTGTVNPNVTFCTNNSPLPVELIAFTAKKAEGVIFLEWSTASEMNNRLFEVQRRMEDGSFTKIAEVTGAGNSKTAQQYHFVDATAPADKTLYYRLRQVDNNGDFAYSGIAAVFNNEQVAIANEVKVYPNPITGLEPMRIILGKDWGPANFQVRNELGQTKLQGQLNAGSQINTAGMDPGVYFIKVYNEEMATTTKIIVR